MIPGTSLLILPAVGSIYDPTGTRASGYEERGPYHCEDCIHKTASDEPFCIHPQVIADPQLQDRLVLIDNRPAIKIDMENGCCEFVRQHAKEGSAPKEQSHEENE
jgi:hypothetical protein